MNRTFWLGAGASSASTLASQPPTIKSFFKVGSHLGLHQDAYFKPFFELILQRWGIAEDVLIVDEPQVTIETILSFFEIEAQNLRARDDELSHGDEQSDLDRGRELLYSYIREVLFKKDAVPLPGESCVRHSAIASTLDGTDAVVSFNYDLIMDKALVDTCRWNEWSGYAPMMFEKIYDIGSWHTAAPSRPDFPPSSSLVYLKLHGSINWFKSTGLLSTPESEESDKIEQDPNHPQRRVISIHSSHAVAREFMSSETVWEGQHVQQLLVPPATYKNYEAFQPLWEKAEETITRAKELVIIGFSFAPADIQAQWLLRRGLTRNQNAVSVMLVDHDEDARERIGKLIHSISSRHRVVHQYKEFDEFVSDLRSEPSQVQPS